MPYVGVKVRTTLYSTTITICSPAFNSTDSKVSQFFSKLNHRKVLLSSSDLNGCTRGFLYCFCKCIHNEKLLRFGSHITNIIQNQSRKETTRLIRNRLPQKIFYRMINCNITGQNQWQSYFTIKNKILEVFIKHG